MWRKAQGPVLKIALRTKNVGDNGKELRGQVFEGYLFSPDPQLWYFETVVLITKAPFQPESKVVVPTPQSDVGPVAGLQEGVPTKGII